EQTRRRDRLVETGLLDGAADEHLTAPPRGEAAVAVEEDVPQRTVRRPEREHLAPHRPDGKLGRDARDTGGPRPGREDDPAGRGPRPPGLAAHETAASPFGGARLGAGDDSRSLPARRLGERLDQPFAGDTAVIRMERRTTRRGIHPWLGLAQRARVEPFRAKPLGAALRHPLALRRGLRL